VLSFLYEHDFLGWPGLPQLELSADDLWRMPSDRPAVPLSFSLMAGKWAAQT
jgi:hypothetical protein